MKVLDVFAVVLGALMLIPMFASVDETRAFIYQWGVWVPMGCVIGMAALAIFAGRIQHLANASESEGGES